jgi:hypothetical protein
MNFKFFVASTLLALLAACGGGGGGGSTTTPTPSTGGNGGSTLPAPQPSPTTPVVVSTPLNATQTKALSTLATIAQLDTDLAITDASIVSGQTLAVLSTFVGGSETSTINCAVAGTINLTITKSAIRAGFTNGDRVNLVYNQCQPIAGLTRSGTLRVTARNTIAPASTTTFSDMAFDLQLTSFRSPDGLLTTALGIAVSDHDQTSTTVSNTYSSALPVSVRETDGSFINSAFVAATSEFVLNVSRKLSFNSLTTVSSGRTEIQFSIDALQPLLSGLAPPSPTAGEFNVTDVSNTPKNSKINLKFGDTTTQVSADGDGNGSSEINFTILTSALLSF